MGLCFRCAILYPQTGAHPGRSRSPRTPEVSSAALAEKTVDEEKVSDACGASNETFPGSERENSQTAGVFFQSAHLREAGEGVKPCSVLVDCEVEDIERRRERKESFIQLKNFLEACDQFQRPTIEKWQE